MMEIDYGPVFVTGGRLKGRILYYDDDQSPRMAICYVGHPLMFCGAYDVPTRFLREPTIDDLIRSREELANRLSGIAVNQEWDTYSSYEMHALWAEKSLIDDALVERRMFGEFGNVSGQVEVFLCHSSTDKGRVRMVHDDLSRLGVKCWLDENKIRVGDSVVSQISSGLGSSQILMIFMSPASVKSMWAQKEWQSFLARQLSGKELRLMPILLEDCDVPPILSDIKYADFRQSYYEGFKEVFKALSPSSRESP